MAAHRLLLSLLTVGILGCFSLGGLEGWELHFVAEPSPNSQFYVLHDWQSTYCDSSTASLPALHVSDVMLKTMGILRDGARWAGVQMANLFSRPRATALFVIDGVSQKLPLSSLSIKSFAVDQTSLTGSVSKDMHAMFDGDSIGSHMSNLFDGRSLVQSVSADSQASMAASADGVTSATDQFTSSLELLRTKPSVLKQYGLKGVLDVAVEEDAAFMAEVVMIRQAVDKLQNQKTVTDDGVPDVFVFTISTLGALEKKHGLDSTKVKVATQVVMDTIQKVALELVSLYEDRILIQALVLAWNFPDISTSKELDAAYSVVRPYLINPNWEHFKANLPQIHLAAYAEYDTLLCFYLENSAGSSFKVQCPSWDEYRYIRDVEEEEYYEGIRSVNITLGNASQGRSENYAAMFLISLFLTICLGLAVLAIGWMMWTMDPGKDSIIYRQVTDPTEGMRM